MTRETKIGLLVGLAFIIVIGILIADYSADSMKRPQAPEITEAAKTVLAGADNPGARRPTGQTPTPVTAPTRQIGENRRPSAERVEVGPPDQQRQRPRTDQPAEPAPQSGGGARLDPLPPNVAVAKGNSRDEAPPAAGSNIKAPPATKEIVAAKNDTIFAWAGKYMGAGSNDNIDAILKANPQLKGNAKAIKVGETYKIPMPASAAPAKTRNDREASQPPSQPLTPQQQAPERDVQPQPQARPEAPVKLVNYTTKPGDNLFKIAVNQCHDPSLIPRIRELNKDQIKGDLIHPNMILKLPAKGT
jgi:LysM repeat protein